MKKPTALQVAGVALAGLAGVLVYATAKRRSRAAEAIALRVESNKPPLGVVIVGAGFGGIEAARQLAKVPGIELTVVDQNNHHLFQPLLYQVATATLTAEDIASPIRDMLAGEATLRMERVTGVDTQSRAVLCGDSRIPYDVLILATGSEASYFGHEAWRKFAPGLKTLDDALSLRQRILSAFEEAVAATDPVSRDRCLTFVLVGGGPTGVEMAGSLTELAHDMLARDYPDLKGPARVILVEAGKTLLAQFTPSQSRYAETQLRRMGVELRLGAEVTDIEAGRLKLGEETITAGTLIWTAGVKATPVARWLGIAPAHGGQVPVGPDLRVKDHPEVYVIGDAAHAVGPDGRKYPGLAAVAKQQGRYVGDQLRGRLEGKARGDAFRYRDYGSLATIGRNRAVAEIGAVHLRGFPAWLVWATVHLLFLNGFRNRSLVSAEWLLSYVTHRRHGRIILDAPGDYADLSPKP